MNFGKGGQNIVQAGNSNPSVFKGAAGNILGQYLGTKMRRAERDYHREKDEESRIRVNEAQQNSRVKANLLEGVMSPQVVGNYFDVANERYDENHPNVVNKVHNPDEGRPYQSGDYVRPQFAGFVNNFGIQTSKHGILPGQPPKGVLQEQERTKRRNQDEVTNQGADNDYSGTVARFDKSGNMTREKLNLDDIEYGEKLSQRPPASMREVDESTRPSNQTFTPQQKADLEKERPRTNGLNDGINDGKGGSN